MKALKQDPEAALNGDTLKLTITSTPTWLQNYTLYLMTKAALEMLQIFQKQQSGCLENVCLSALVTEGKKEKQSDSKHNSQEAERESEREKEAEW